MSNETSKKNDTGPFFESWKRIFLYVEITTHRIFLQKALAIPTITIVHVTSEW